MTSGAVTDPRPDHVASPLSDQRRAGLWVRRQAVERELRLLKAHWKILSSVAIACLAITAALAYVTDGTVRGFVLGIGFTSCFWLLAAPVAMAAGTTATRMGDSAERWTAHVLAGLGSEWTVLHDIPGPHGNVDHIAVGPSGTYVIETKWRATAQTRRELEALARTVARRAKDSYWELHASGVDTRVNPVLCLWSAMTQSNAEPLVGDTLVVSGNDLVELLTARSETTTLKTHRRRVVEVITDKATSYEIAHPDLRPTSWVSMLGPWIGMPLGAGAALILCLAIASQLTAGLLWIAEVLALAALAIALGRIPGLRPTMLGALAGVVVGSALLLGVFFFG